MRAYQTVVGRLAVALLVLAMLAGKLAASPVDRIGEKVEDVTLGSLKGEAVSLLDQHTGKVLVIAYTGLGCPISSRYAPRLEELSKKFAAKGVHFVGINANPQDNAEAIGKEIGELGIGFPVFQDQEQKLTRQLDAKTTTEVFVVDAEHVIRYRGMIDDQYAVGAQRPEPKNRYLEQAIQAVLRDREPHIKRTAAPGCLITRLPSDASQPQITYSSHVARILQDNCQACHRVGQIAPFPLSTYEEAAGWSAMMYSVLQDGRMPPWNADGEYDGLFVNQRKLSEQDKKTLLAWIEGGMPRGNPQEDPPAKEWPKNWRIGDPDKVFTMPKAFAVPKEGVVEYQYFTVPTPFKEDKWITAMEARPGAEDVVHHILVFLQDSAQPPVDRSRLGLEDGFLCATVPGDTPSVFPDGHAKKLPAGATLVFQVHYTTNGKRRSDRCSIGMVFTDGPVEREVLTRGIYNLNFEIPAGHANYEVSSSHTFSEEVDILSFFPHMHTRGKDFRYVAHLPDGTKRTLLTVSRYDFNWQESYILKEPIRLLAGTKLECIAHYDNSEANFANPDPTAAVRFGEQTWEEMMIGYIDYVRVGGATKTASR